MAIEKNSRIEINKVNNGFTVMLSFNKHEFINFDNMNVFNTLDHLFSFLREIYPETNPDIGPK